MFSGFMTNAWVIGTIVAIVAGVVGFFVVLRGSAFPAHAIPNGAFSSLDRVRNAPPSAPWASERSIVRSKSTMKTTRSVTS